MLRGKRGLTLIEILISVLLMSVVFLGVAALYVSSQMLYFTSNDKVILSYEFQYAIEHIYKNVMRAIGDEISPPGSRPINIPNAETLNITINNNDPLTQTNYGDTRTYSYSKSDGKLIFNDGSSSESLVPKITVTGVSFALSGNLLTLSLTGTYKDQTLTFYSACYPRLASFQ